MVLRPCGHQSPKLEHLSFCHVSPTLLPPSLSLLASLLGLSKFKLQLPPIDNTCQLGRTADAWNPSPRSFIAIRSILCSMCRAKAMPPLTISNWDFFAIWPPLWANLVSIDSIFYHLSKGIHFARWISLVSLQLMVAVREVLSDSYFIHRPLWFKVYISYVSVKCKCNVWNYDSDPLARFTSVTKKDPERSRTWNCEPIIWLNMFFCIDSEYEFRFVIWLKVKSQFLTMMT